MLDRIVHRFPRDVVKMRGHSVVMDQNRERDIGSGS